MTCELPRFYAERTIQARKEHVCCECHHLIKPGMCYMYIKGVWNSEWVTYRMCLKCNHIRFLAFSKYPPDFEEEGPGFGLLYDWIRECRR